MSKKKEKRQAVLSGDEAETPTQVETGLLANMRAAVIATYPDGQIMFWNAFATEMYGWTAEEALGRKITEVVVPQDAQEEASAIMAVLNSGRSWMGEFRVKHKDGRRFTASVTDSPILGAKGELIGIVGVSYDVTAAKQAEEELKEVSRELEERVKERTAELNAANESLRSLSGMLLRLRDEERRRLARELHDSLGQLIAATGMNLAMIRGQQDKLDETGVRAIVEIAELVQEMNRQTRTISHLLHPPLLDEVGLVSALRWYVEEFSARSGIKVQLEIADSFGRIASDLEIAIFRIVQECLINVHRHSGSQVAIITVMASSEEITVRVEDKGHGISAEKLAELKSPRVRGVGFRGMQERVRYLGGTWGIHSDENGTVIVTKIPLGNKERAAAGGL